MQFHSTLPAGRLDQVGLLADGERAARWRIRSARARWRSTVLRCSRRSAASVVQRWPSCPMYWRSSSQIGHAAAARVARRELGAAGDADVMVHRSSFPGASAYCAGDPGAVLSVDMDD